MLAKTPIVVDRIPKEEIRRQALRVAIIAELDAISLYEQLAAMVEDESMRRVLLSIAREEKIHVGELLELLLRVDEDQGRCLESGREEAREIIEGEH